MPTTECRMVRSVRTIVQRPVVVVVDQLDAAAQEFLFRRGQMLAQEVHGAAAPGLEVILEPIQDLAEVDGRGVTLAIDADVLEETTGLLIERLMQSRAANGARRHGRAAPCRAVDGEVDARVFEVFPN